MVEICNKEKTCVYWRGINNSKYAPFCNHLLDTGCRRVGDVDHCESKEIGKRRKRVSFDCPMEQQGL